MKSEIKFAIAIDVISPDSGALVTKFLCPTTALLTSEDVHYHEQFHWSLLEESAHMFTAAVPFDYVAMTYMKGMVGYTTPNCSQVDCREAYAVEIRTSLKRIAIDDIEDAISVHESTQMLAEFVETLTPQQRRMLGEQLQK